MCKRLILYHACGHPPLVIDERLGDRWAEECPIFGDETRRSQRVCNQPQYSCGRSQSDRAEKIAEGAKEVVEASGEREQGRDVDGEEGQNDLVKNQ